MTEDESYNDDVLEEEGALGHVQAYQLAVTLDRVAVDDARRIARDFVLREVAPQLVYAVGSIGARIAEGYPRRSQADRVRYYEYALGSAMESRRWYCTARSALPEVVRERLSILASIRRLLMAMIRNDRDGKTWGTPGRRRK